MIKAGSELAFILARILFWSDAQQTSVIVF